MPRSLVGFPMQLKRSAVYLADWGFGASSAMLPSSFDVEDWGSTLPPMYMAKTIQTIDVGQYGDLIYQSPDGLVKKQGLEDVHTYL